MTTTRAETGRWITRAWALSFAAATLIGALYGAQRVILRFARGQDPEWVQTVGVQMVPWFAWALLVPAIFVWCRRTALDSVPTVRWVALYGAAGLMASFTHTALCVVPIGLLSRWTTVGWPLHIGYQQLLLNRGVAAWTEFVMIAALLQALLFYQRMREREQTAGRLAAQLAEAELRTLRMQLEPHFLFNTLNAIAAYLRTAPDTAEAMLGHLSRLLRLVLDGHRAAEVPLAQEIELVRRYLAIHEVRFGNRFRVHVDVEPGSEMALVPAMLLQPLVENAVVHGASRRRGASVVRVCARRQEATLCLLVEDAVNDARLAAVAQTTAASAVAGDGIGLKNTRARLAALYGADQSVTVSAGVDRSCVMVHMPFRTATATEVAR